MVGTKMKISESMVSRLLENSFLTLFLTATAAAVMFLGFIESHEFYNPI